MQVVGYDVLRFNKDAGALDYDPNNEIYIKLSRNREGDWTKPGDDAKYMDYSIVFGVIITTATPIDTLAD